MVSMYLASAVVSIRVSDVLKMRRQRSRCSGSNIISHGLKTGACDSTSVMWWLFPGVQITEKLTFPAFA